MKTLFFILLFIFDSWANQIFTQKKEFIYLVQYHQKELNLTTHEEVTLSITGNTWKSSADQKEAVWKYRTKSETQYLFKNQFSLGWLSSDTTGILENDDRIYLHPPRHNQYLLTEIAPFPDFRIKKEVGEQYSSITFIGKGFGQWEGKKVKCTYSVSSMDKGIEDIIWKINANSEVEGKTNNCEFIVSNKRGFVSISYSFYNGDSMTMKLQQ
jgi:hypothetical protein